MSPRKLAVDKTSARNFPEKQNFKPRSNEKKLSHSNDGFFIKKSKNKNNIPSDDSVNQKTSFSGSQKKVPRKKETYPDPVGNLTEQETTKKPFDKKNWRFKRYNKKFKIEQWKEVRKTRMLRQYDKTLKKNKPVAINFEEESEDPEENAIQGTEQTGKLRNNSDTVKNLEESDVVQISAFSKRKKAYQGDEEKEDKQIEYLKRKAAKEAAAKEYKRKKLEKYKKLNQKTRKGQPVMKGRIEVLLEEIEKSIGK